MRVDADGIGPTPRADVHVPRHVHDMSGTGHQRRQPFGARQRPLGVHRLYGVDIQVTPAGMFRIARQHALEARQQQRGPRARPAIRLPVVPRREVHQRVGVQHLHFIVTRRACRERADALRPRGVQRGAVRLRHGGIAHRQRLDQRPFPRRHAGRRPTRARDGTKRLHARGRIHGGVDVRAQRIGGAPRAHRTAGVDLLGGLEGADGLVVVEPPQQPQPLIEVLLRQRHAHRDGVVMRPQIGVQRRPCTRRPRCRRCHVMGLRRE